MLNLLQQLVHWLHTHPEWAGIITFLVTFTESLAIVGLFIPGSVLLTMIGGLVGAHIVPATGIFIGAIAGAIGGDTLSYFLGYHYQNSIRQIWPFYKFIPLLEKAERFFAKHGGKSVFLGRFLGPLRPTIPIISGMMRLKPHRFLTANISSALLWAPGYMVPGILVGAGAMHAAPHHAGYIIVQVTVGLLLLWLFYWLIRSAVLNFFARLNVKFTTMRHKMESSLLRNVLRDAEKPQSHRQLWLCLAMLSSAIVFLILFALVAAHIDLSSINLPIHKDLLAISNPIADTIFIILTQLGEKAIMLPVGAIVFIYFAWQKRWYLAWHWLALLVLTVAALGLFKHLGHSPRPTDLVLAPTDYSFPSGHVGLALSFWGFLAYLFAEQFTNKYSRRNAYTLVSLIVILVGFSRIYLGVHWLTDIIGSVLLGLTCLCLIILSYRRRLPDKTLNLTALSLVIVISFGLFAGLFLYKNFPIEYRDYKPAKIG